jgi:hypothetical protein
MKLALSQEEESQRTVHGGGRRRRAGEEQGAGVTVELVVLIRAPRWLGERHERSLVWWAV